jgi:hypothetical protein
MAEPKGSQAKYGGQARTAIRRAYATLTREGFGQRRNARRHTNTAIEDNMMGDLNGLRVKAEDVKYRLLHVPEPGPGERHGVGYDDELCG